MSIVHKLKSLLITYSLVIITSINLLAISSILTLNNNAEAAPPPPPPMSPPAPPPLPLPPVLDTGIVIDLTTSCASPALNAGNIAAELGKEFNVSDTLKRNRKNTSSKHASSSSSIDPNTQTKELLSLLSEDFYDAKKRLTVIKDIVQNKNLSFEDKKDLLKKINLAGGKYTKDNNGNIQIENSDIISGNFKSDQNYTSNFDPNHQYKILYSTPAGNLEKDITSEIMDIVKGFERDSKGNKYTKLDAVVLQEMEQKKVYDLVKSRAESLIKSAYGNNIDFVKYYDDNINDDTYKKYFTQYEKDVIEKALGYKRAYAEKTELIKKEIVKIDKSTLSIEEYEKECEKIFEKFGENSWDSYQVSKTGSSSKISYDEYEKLAINEAKKRAIVAKFLTEDTDKIDGKRLKIIREDGSEEYVDNSEFNLVIPKNDWDLTPINIPVSQVMETINDSLSNESEKVKKLLAKIELLENDTELEETKRKLQELEVSYKEKINKYEKLSELIELDKDNNENVKISVNKNMISILKILKDNPEFITIIKENVDLFPAMFSNHSTLEFLEKCSVEDYQDMIAELEKLLNSKAQELYNQDDIGSLEQKIREIEEQQYLILEAKEAEIQAQKGKIFEKAALLNKVVSNHHKSTHMLINNRFAPAIAAGDEEMNIIIRGVWVSGSYGVSYQNAYKDVPKYHGCTASVTIGADTNFGDSSDIIGIAYSKIGSQFKYNKKLGKTILNGHLLSVYGLKELLNNFSLESIVSFGHNYVKNKNTNNIFGKYQNNSLNIEALLRYTYFTKYDLQIIPHIGLKYDYSKNSDYRENNKQNLIIQKKSNRLSTGIIGNKIVLKPIKILNDITLIPSLHGSIENHFYNKNAVVKAKATFNDQIIEEKIILAKQPKFGYNIGGGIILNKKNIDISVEYNYYKQKKYQSHQGLVKLKVNL